VINADTPRAQYY